MVILNQPRSDDEHLLTSGRSSVAHLEQISFLGTCTHTVNSLGQRTVAGTSPNL